MTGPAASRAPLRALLSLAWREGRSARRRLLVYMSSISLGVAALVAIDSFASNVQRSIADQSRALLGGDVSLTSRRPFPASVDSLLDSLARQRRLATASQTSFASMGVIPRSGATRLVQVRAITARYPFYGDIVTEPAGRWATLQSGRHALVDPALLVALDARVGDTLSLGYGRFDIAGVLRSVPGDPGVAAIIGPRVFIPARYLAETKLVGFGSRAEYETLVRLPEGTRAETWVAGVKARLQREQVRTRTVAEQEASLTSAIGQLGDFLGVVGLIALLLGGIGVASGVHAFVTRKIDAVAVLRCLGATSGQVLFVYVLQAAAMGLVGAAGGALLGVAIQLGLPRAVGDFLPVDVTVRPVPVAVATGLLLGVGVALLFALRPLVGLRSVSPMQTLRRDTDTGALARRRGDWRPLLVSAAIVVSVTALAMLRAPNARTGLVLAGGIAAVLLALWSAGGALTWLARRAVRIGWPYAVRQGVANLHRPANQTRAVVLSLGFGAFLVSTLYLVQTNLLRRFAVDTAASRGNLLFFDVQDDQGPGVDSIVRAGGYQIVERAPIVTMRIAAVNGVAVPPLGARAAADSAPEGPPPRGGQQRGRQRGGWALRREYRSTYRDTMVESEQLRTGRWFGAPRAAGDTLPAVSLDVAVADDIGARVGDEITWDVQGVKIPTRVTSTREVNWARFEPNFFAVFEPRALSGAPQQFVVLARVTDREAAARVQRDMVRRYPNVSSIDLSLIVETVGKVVQKVSLAVRFIALFGLAIGVPVLFSAVAATRNQRIREGVLLKTLGATRAQIRRIMLAEYAALGLLGSAAGMALSFAGAWGVMHYVFKAPFAPAYAPALAIAALMLALTLLIGMIGGRSALRETPMAALREA